MKNKLLEKVKRVPVRIKGSDIPYTVEELEVSLAFLNGEITANQYGDGVGIPRSSVYVRAMTIFRWALNMGYIEVSLKSEAETNEEE